MEDGRSAPPRKNQGRSVPEVRPEFKFLQCIGKGAFGAVFKVRELTGDGRVMAIKRVTVDPNYVNREVDILKNLDHPNCIHLWGQFVMASPLDGKERLHLVMDYYPTSIEDFVGEQPYRGPQGIDRLRLHVRQILEGLTYLHARDICHRDLKPQNVLIDPRTDRVAICDFGSAKYLDSDTTSSATYIGSRFYRAPELLLGWEDYGLAIDMWSLGCVVAEMALGRPLFEGRNTHEQLRLIVATLGNRVKKALFRADPKFARLTDLPNAPSLAAVLAHCPADLRSLVESLLQFEAEKRPSAEEALRHPFLAAPLQNGD